MPTTIPTEQEMLNLASEQKHIPVDQLKKDIDAFAIGFSSFLPKRLLTYRYLVDVLKVQPELSVIAPQGLITIADMKKSQAKTGIHIQGYLVGNELSKTREKQEPIYFITLMDKTDSIRGTVFFEKVFDMWEEKKFETGIFLEVDNCGVDEYKEKKTLRISESTHFAVLKEPPFSLEDISMSINSLKEGDAAYIRCMIVVVEDNPAYIGCPYCLKKFTDVDEGTEVECINEKCSHAGETVVAEELQFMRCFCSDGNDDIRISFDPRLTKKYGMNAFAEGRWIEVLGSASENGEFRARSVTFKDLFKDANKEIAKRVIPSAKMGAEAAAEKISFMLASYDTMEEKELLQNSIDLLDIDEAVAKEAIEIAVNKGLIKKNKDKYEKIEKKKRE